MTPASQPRTRSLPRWFVEHRIAGWLSLPLILLLGTLAFLDLPRRQDPEVRVGILELAIPWAGQPAAVIDEAITLPLGRRFASRPEVAQVRGLSAQDVGLLRVEIRETERDVTAVLDGWIAGLSIDELPSGAGPIVVARGSGDVATRLIVLAAPSGAREELESAAAHLSERLTQLPAVSHVRSVGALTPQATITVHPDQRALFEVSAIDLPGFLEREGLIDTRGVLELPGPLAPTVGPARPLDARDREALIARWRGAIVARGPGGFEQRLGQVAAIDIAPPAPPLERHRWAQRGASGVADSKPAITLAVMARSDVPLAVFARQVDELLVAAPASPVTRYVLSDQAAATAEDLVLFETSLLEAIGLVMLVALIGFRSLRHAVLMAGAIPVTLALTAIAMWALGLELHQVSIGALILSLGLLVDDPVVAGDAVQSELERGVARRIAAWRGPQRLARAILFATLTNIAAYLPLLLVQGHVGRFIVSLPLVVSAALIASRLVSMTFVPWMAAHVVALPQRRRSLPDPTHAPRWLRAWAPLLAHRGGVVMVALGALAVGGLSLVRLDEQFFPRDPSNLASIEMTLPPGTPLTTTDAVAQRVEAALVGTAGDDSIEAVASFVGRPAPRYWFSIDQTPPRPELAQLIVRFARRDDPWRREAALQVALDRVAALAPRGTMIDFRQLEIGKPVGAPIQVRVTAHEAGDRSELERDASRVAAILRGGRGVVRVRVDQARDVPALPIELALPPLEVSAGQPVLLRLPAAEQTGERLPSIDGHPSITVGAFAAAGHYAATALRGLDRDLEALARDAVFRSTVSFGGEREEQRRGFGQLTLALIASLALLAAMLLAQFRSAVKVMIVLAAIPFGVIGACLALWLADAPFGFMAFLGIASLIGVIVSHIIVLFDGIEELRKRGGMGLEDALALAIHQRARPVLVTVAAAVMALLPLAARGGPLWYPLCVAQIGGLSLATLVTLVLGPVLYTIAVRDLRWLRWGDENEVRE